MANHTKLTPVAREKFLKALVRNGGNVSLAAKSIKMNRRYMYEVKARPTETKFSEAWDNAVEEGIDAVEGEIFRRAVKGVNTPVFYKGELVTIVKEYSDRLLECMIKAKRPEYRDGPTIVNTNTVVLEQQRKQKLEHGLRMFGANLVTSDS